MQAASVVIYELDTPIVSSAVASDSLACLASQSLASLFTVSDPANRAITSWQAYDTAASDSLLLNGTAFGAHSAASAVTSASLASVTLRAGATATTDTLEVRAFNGLYWGDWQSLAVSVTAAAAAPVLAIQTPNQTWTGGKAISLATAGWHLQRPAASDAELHRHAVERPGAAELAQLQRDDGDVLRHCATDGAEPEHQGHRDGHRRAIGGRTASASR